MIVIVQRYLPRGVHHCRDEQTKKTYTIDLQVASVLPENLIGEELVGKRIEITSIEPCEYIMHAGRIL